MGFTPAGFAATGGSDTFHFPDGNASIARLLVRSLIPTAMPGRDARDIVTAVADYTKLDRPESAARIRLNSTVLRVRNVGSDRVEVIYSRGGTLVPNDGAPLRARLLEHDDSVSLPGAARSAEGSAASADQDAARLRQCCAEELARVPASGRQRSRSARLLLLELRTERSGRHRRLQERPLARRADPRTHGAHAGKVRAARARAAQSRSRRTSRNAVRNVRAPDPRRARPRAGPAADSIRHATSKASPSIAGRTATRRSTTASSTATRRRNACRTSSADDASDASRSRIPTPAWALTPTLRSSKRIAPCMSC